MGILKILSAIVLAVGMIFFSMKSNKHLIKESNSHESIATQTTPRSPDQGMLISPNLSLAVVSTRPSEESFHVEYPSVYTTSKGKLMSYSAFGDDHRWRIKLAFSQDGISWERWGNIFDERELPIKGNYAFPFVLQSNPGNHVFLMLFAAAENKGDRYNQLWQTASADGFKWQTPIKVLSDELILDPVVTQYHGKEVVLYTSEEGKGNSVIKMVTKENNEITEPKVVYRTGINEGLYTIGVFVHDKTPIFILESGNQKNTRWLAKCLNKGNNLVPAAKKPLLVTEDKKGQWDSLKYGPFFMQEGDQDMVVYFNGIKDRGEEVGGQIGFASIDKKSLKDLINLENCA